MIYLIEDKKTRRNDYGWTDEKLSSLKDVITIVENANRLTELMPEIPNSGNVVLYHESFTKNESYDNERDVKAFINSLEEARNIHIAYFSGSKTQRKNEGLICNLNYDPLYTNLNVFIKYYQQGTIDFDYLLFGENPEIENKLLQQIQKINNENVNITAIESSCKILAFRTSEDPIQFPVIKAKLEFCDYDCSDKGMIFLIKEISNSQYDAIYIPLCMGETLSDYLGLRLAMLLRLMDTGNKFAHIFIYGIVRPLSFFKYECSEVLKMPGVHYILSDGTSIKNSIRYIRRINNEEYRLGLKLINLNVPTNIGDTHSVANMWGIYRWSEALMDSDDAIKKNNEEVYYSLYFRYLAALYPPTEKSHIERKNILIKKGKQMPELNILYVDDDADEGWYELLCHIIYDLNDIKKFDYVGRELKSMDEDEIINCIMSRIKNEDINTVILDLRLHNSDFNQTIIDDIVGFRLLKKIKHYNRGIQVLIFSATNKIWNLQALQKEEADGFIMKEAPENSVDDEFTENSILQFVNLLSVCSNNTYRKDLWIRTQKEMEQIVTLRKRKLINKEYAKAVEVLLKMTEDALFSRDMQYAYATAFMNLFRIIEATSNEWIDKNAVVEKSESGEIISYFRQRKDGSQLLKFNSKVFNPHPTEKLVFNKENPSLPYFQKICNVLHFVGSFNNNAFNIVSKRNNFTHPDLIENSEIETFSVQDVITIFDIVEQLIMNQLSK